ncbi:MAG: hypothetical protein ACPLRA_04780, partial [Candidatus Saccharicenans sp.]
ERSDCGAEVYLENLPVSSALKKCSRKYGWNLEEVAAAGGEDYCLLITVDFSQFSGLAKIFRRRFGRKLQAIGKVTSKKGTLSYSRKNKPVFLKKSGYDHFQR